MFACSGVGFFMALSFSWEIASLFSVIVPLVTGHYLGGLSPSYRNPGDVYRFLMETSYSRWAIESLMQQEQSYLPQFLSQDFDGNGAYVDVDGNRTYYTDQFGHCMSDFFKADQDGPSERGIKCERGGYSILILFSIGVIWRLLALVSMYG